MGSTSFLKPKSSVYKNKSGSSIGSDKEMNGKLRRQKIRRPSKMTDYGLKRLPDYTEMAYKEAVSKLRYFFSGNYAPSVRSFGSPSIKNLDESDGDLDKKYQLAEYKPRPRLTAKYTTLYADSLNNATQPRNITPHPPAADLSGGTNPDVVNFIQKQEEYIEQLERESQYCRDELNNLLGKVKEVISENEHLHEAQKNKIISRMFHSYNAGSETDDLDDLGDSTGLDSDNKASPSKSRRSGKLRSTRLEGPNIVFESRISELEAQLTQAKIDNKKIQDENNENKRKLASGLVDSTCLDGFKRQIDNLQRDKSSLESQIAKLKTSLEQRDLNELDGRQSRSDHELQLRDQRDRLEDEVRRLKEDLSKERNKSRSLAGEGARRALQERSAAEQRYTAHCDDLQRDLAAQYDNLAKMQLELERQRREENDLKREISMKNAAIDDLRMDLKNKTSSLQADLAQAYAEKASLEEELASARLAIERHQRQAKHETNRLNSEIQSLRQRLDRADADVVHARRENLRLTEQVANLEKEINIRNLTPISPEKQKKEKEISSMLETMDNKHAKTVAELESMIHSQNSLMEKLTGECRLLTDKLDDANRRHKEQLATLHRQVDYLTVSLQSTQNAPNAYEAPTPHQTATDRTVPQAATTGRDYTGSDTTGYSQVGDQSITNFQDVREDRRDLGDHVPSRRVSKQNSRTSLLSQEPIANETKPFEAANITPTSFREESAPQQQEDNVYDDDYTEKEYKDQNEKEKPIENSEYEQQQYSDKEYAQNTTDAQYPTQPDYEDPSATKNVYQNQEYDQSAYQQDYPQSTEYSQEQPEYSQEPQGYTQQSQDFTQPQQGYETEQAGYTQEQYENYEQYPQQYADPNAQYDQQAYDQNYVAEADYDQTQYNQNYTDETQDAQPQIETNIQQTPSENNSQVAQEKQVKSEFKTFEVSRNGKSSPPKGKYPSKS